MSFSKRAMSMRSLVMFSYWKGRSLDWSKLGFKKHEAERTMVWAAMEIIPVARYSSIDGMLSLLLHLDSVIHESNVSYHCIIYTIGTNLKSFIFINSPVEHKCARLISKFIGLNDL